MIILIMMMMMMMTIMKYECSKGSKTVAAFQWGHVSVAVSVQAEPSGLSLICYNLNNEPTRGGYVNLDLHYSDGISGI